MPKTGRWRLQSMSWALIEATHQATNAAVSIIPSMPMLTTPERSHMKPHSAPSAIGIAGQRRSSAQWSAGRR